MIAIRTFKTDICFETGSLPTLDDLKKFLVGSSGKSKDKWTSIKNTSAEGLLRRDHIVVPKNLMGDLGFSKLGESNKSNSSDKPTGRKRPVKSSFLTQQGNVVGGGTRVVLNALAAYLRYAEGTMQYDWQEYVL